MEAYSNKTISNIFLYTILGSGIVNIPYTAEHIVPENKLYSTDSKSIRIDWNEHLFSNEFRLPNSSDNDKYQTVVDFSKDLLNNSQDIEKEYVDIVNDNFWDLI